MINTTATAREGIGVKGEQECYHKHYILPQAKLFSQRGDQLELLTTEGDMELDIT